jgi:molybdopterin-guanine dinucleotide biosynthesis protein MobB
MKHDVHGFDVDVPGTDSYRLREAGAAVTGISSPEKYVWIANTDEERELPQLLRQLPEKVDLVITEGFKRQPAPKVEVSRRERSTELICPAGELIGIVSDQRFPDYAVDQLAMTDFPGIADLVMSRILP